MRLIDADALKSVYERYLNAPHVRLDNAVGHGMRIAIETCMELLENESTVDAVEVVRCKDCKYYRESKHPERTGIKFCYRLKDGNGENIGYNYSDDDFCSYGERKEP